MTNIDTLNTLKDLFQCWCEMTGQELRYPPTERILYEFHRAEFTEADLRCVLGFLLWRNKKLEPKYRTRLLIHRLLEPEWFNSQLGEAKAWERNRQKFREKAKTVAAFRGTDAEPEQVGQVRHVSEVFKAMSQAKLGKAWQSTEYNQKKNENHRSNHQGHKPIVNPSVW